MASSRIILLIIFCTLILPESPAQNSISNNAPEQPQTKKRSTGKVRGNFADNPEPQINMAAIAGIWIPTGGIKKLGLHPELGIQLGYRKSESSIDVTLIFKFLDSPNYYDVHINDTTQSTSHFFGGYFGLDYRRAFRVIGNNEFSFLAGLGLDGFDTVESNNSNGQKGASANSYNLNFGLGYRHYSPKNMHLGINVKYNIVDYSLSGVIDFTGNPVTVHFIIGGLSNKPSRY